MLFLVARHWRAAETESCRAVFMITVADRGDVFALPSRYSALGMLRPKRTSGLAPALSGEIRDVSVLIQHPSQTQRLISQL